MPLGKGLWGATARDVGLRAKDDLSQTETEGGGDDGQKQEEGG